jgi:hypothetical protein
MSTLRLLESRQAHPGRPLAVRFPRQCLILPCIEENDVCAGRCNRLDHVCGEDDGVVAADA